MINRSDLVSALSYDPDTGVFKWLDPDSNKYVPGGVAGTRNTKGYIQLWFKGGRGLAHRLAWLYVYGEIPCGQIDHINGVRDDNRISNLRVVENQDNSKNRRMRKDNKIGIQGVRMRGDASTWVASIAVDFKQVHLGSFPTLLDAACARKSAEIKHGFHANHGVRELSEKEEMRAEIARLNSEIERLSAAKPDAELMELLSGARTYIDRNSFGGSDTIELIDRIDAKLAGLRKEEA
jgi:hypothetical protein